MILVLPFCAKDGDLALKNLQWIEELDPKLPYHCILSHDNATPAPMIRDMGIVANRVFQKVTVTWYPEPQKKHWPAAANWAFQNAARYIAHFHPNESWLFLEADATPIRSGWLQALEAEHIKGGKPFTGHVVDGMGHPNGVAIYPPMVAAFSQDAMRVEETAWDVVIGATVDEKLIHHANEIIRHCWCMNEDTRECTNGHGIMPTFRSVHDVVAGVDLKASLYHRCKDGSLIHWLREFYKAPHKAMVPDHTSNEPEPEQLSAVEEIRQSKDEWDSDSEDVSRVPDVVPEADVPRGTEDDTLHEPIPKTEIFIVTFGLPTLRTSNLVISDFDWLAWCLRCIRRHCVGFTGITLAIPDRDAARLKPLANEHAGSKGGIPLRIKMFREPPGKGHIMHMAVMGSADEFVPKGTEYVLHLDADCMFKVRTTPLDYIKSGKPDYVIRSYDSLFETRNGKKVMIDCAQWRAPTEEQLGFQTPVYTMCRHPTCYPIGFYKEYRKHLVERHKKPYIEYMVSGRNDFPPDRMDFTAMGAFTYERMRDKFNWIDVSNGNHLAPKDRQQTYWSHRGITKEIEAEIKSFLT